MTFSPTSIIKVREADIRVERQDGLYTIKNAYDGEYEYFKNRPLPKLKEVRQQDRL